MTPERQRAADQSEIKVKRINNGLLVRGLGDGWLYFKSWEEASPEIGKKLDEREHKSDRA